MEAAIARALQQTEAAARPEEDDFEGGSSDEEGSDLEAGGHSDSSSSGDEPAGSDTEGSEGQGEEEELDDDFGDDEGAAGGSEGEGGDSEGQEAGSSGDEEDEEGQPAGGQGFLEGGKADAFARAFSKIIHKAEGAGEGEEAPILAGSKSIAKRRAEVEQTEKQDREAKRLRMEMKQRGHVIPKRRGQDPSADLREKALQRLATRGVVKLFNAIAKAQKQLREAQEATGSRAKAAKLGRASFLAELKGGAARAAGTAGAAGAAGDQVMVPSAPGQAAAAGSGGGKQKQQQPGAAAQRQQRGRLAVAAAGGGSSSEEEGDAGWEVLQKGFAGLQGGSKMKDWDKQASDEEEAGEQLGDSSDGDSEGEGW